MLRRGLHNSNHLQRAFNRDGEQSFIVDVIEFCQPEFLLKREQEMLDQLKSYDDAVGYNLNPIANSGPKVVFTDEMRAAISARFKGKPKSEEHKKRIGLGQKHREYSSEMRQRISEKLKQYFSDPENRKAQSIRQTGLKRKSTPISEERKIKMSLERKGKPSPETRKYKPEQIRDWIALRDRDMSYFAMSLETKVNPAVMKKSIDRYLRENPPCS